MSIWRESSNLFFLPLSKREKRSQEIIPIEQHFGKIKNEKMRKIAIELRDATNRILDDITEKTTTRYVAFSIAYIRRSTFSRIITQNRGFWFVVKIPGNEFNLRGLNARRQFKGETHIRVNENTELSLLIEAAKQAYKRIRRKRTYTHQSPFS